MTANLIVFPASQFLKTGRNEGKVKAAKGSSECPQGRKTYLGALQMYVEKKTASRGRDLISKRERMRFRKMVYRIKRHSAILNLS